LNRDRPRRPGHVNVQSCGHGALTGIINSYYGQGLATLPPTPFRTAVAQVRDADYAITREAARVASKFTRLIHALLE
jgi:hypothetical protein